MKHYSLKFHLIIEIDMIPEPLKQIVGSISENTITHDINNAQYFRGQWRIMKFLYAKVQ